MNILTIDQVLERHPYLGDRQALATLRYKGTGPKFLKPSPRKVLYDEQAIFDWLSSTETSGTSSAVAA